MYMGNVEAVELCNKFKFYYYEKILCLCFSTFSKQLNYNFIKEFFGLAE